MTQATNHLLYLYQRDTLRNNPDSLRWVWRQLRTNAARYAEAGSLIGQGRLTDAHDLVDAMPDERSMNQEELDERARMLTYIDILSTAADHDRTPYQLDSQEVSDLDDMVGDNYDQPSAWASNLLCTVYRICRSPYTGGDGGERRPLQQTSGNAQPTSRSTSQFSLQPNPARGWVAFNYQLPKPSPQGQIVVRDFTGRPVAQLPMNAQQGQQVLDTRGLAAGTYLVEYRDAAMTLHADKLVIEP